MPGLYLFDYVRPKPLEELAELPNAVPPKYSFPSKLNAEGIPLSSAEKDFV